jgi:hypothetical protein
MAMVAQLLRAKCRVNTPRSSFGTLRVGISQKALGQLDPFGGRMGPASEDFMSQRDNWRRKHLMGEPYAECSRLRVIASLRRSKEERPWWLGRG